MMRFDEQQQPHDGVDVLLLVWITFLLITRRQKASKHVVCMYVGFEKKSCCFGPAEGGSVGLGFFFRVPLTHGRFSKTAESEGDPHHIPKKTPVQALTICGERIAVVRVVRSNT